MSCLLDAGEFLEAEEFSFSIALYSWQNFTPNWCLLDFLIAWTSKLKWKMYNSGAPASRTAAGTEPHRHHGKSKETNEFIFSWLSWLAVLLVGAYAQRRWRWQMAQIVQLTGKLGNTALVYSVLLWYWTSMSWSTDTCQNRVSAEYYHMIISRAQV